MDIVGTCILHGESEVLDMIGHDNVAHFEVSFNHRSWISLLEFWKQSCVNVMDSFFGNKLLLFLFEKF